MSRRPNTSAPKRRAPGARTVQGALAGSPSCNRGPRARRSGLPPPTPSGGPRGPPGTGSFCRAPWPTGTERQGEGPRGAAGADGPSGDRRGAQLQPVP